MHVDVESVVLAPSVDGAGRARAVLDCGPAGGPRPACASLRRKLGMRQGDITALALDAFLAEEGF